jgi:hypothetical protein
MRIIYNDNKLYLSLRKDEQVILHTTKPIEISLDYLHVLHKDISDAIYRRYKELDEQYRPEAYVIEGSQKTNN